VVGICVIPKLYFKKKVLNNSKILQGNKEIKSLDVCPFLKKNRDS
jgi:hypothetical protein